MHRQQPQPAGNLGFASDGDVTTCRGDRIAKRCTNWLLVGRPGLSLKPVTEKYVELSGKPSENWTGPVKIGVGAVKDLQLLN